MCVDRAVIACALSLAGSSGFIRRWSSLFALSAVEVSSLLLLEALRGGDKGSDDMTIGGNTFPETSWLDMTVPCGTRRLVLASPPTTRLYPLPLFDQAVIWIRGQLLI